MDLQQINDACPICLDAFKNPYSIGCSHLFCKKCIDTWLEERNTCPVCRKCFIGRFSIPISIVTSKYKTRKITEYWRGFKVYVKIHKMMEVYNNEIHGTENSCIYMNDIFKYIYENRWIFNSNRIVYKWLGADQFKNVLKNRLKVFSKHPKFKEGKIWEYKFRDILK